ncbi:hypothetical protein PGC08_02545 [Brevibacterium sp. BDJS002]|uniref:DUF6036 family nucleotidyltransferase n=1 Tax=Brevibacterium sp. BDJS002 TaxID=3020906 RepID=UPI002306E807|nr:DUF6036 family nucleotidyltransferase [Brevibacterium sp. BDJS002]WCE40599.1 hypothetical protein PGC08_02545 [Brevibacterium sp. BDJS002]
MNRQELAHILRAACRITGDQDVLVIGSQSILGTFDEDDLPALATASMEADIAFLNDPDRAKADHVEGAIGEMSSFHQMYGIYAEGVHVTTATYLPKGWRDRLVSWPLRSSEPADPHFLEPHDLAIAKLGAAREKDRGFVDALIKEQLLDVSVLQQRCALLSDKHSNVKKRISSLLSSYSV